MWEVSISTVPEAITDDRILGFNQDIDSNLTSGSRISTTLISPDQILVVFSNHLSEDDIKIVNDSVTVRFEPPPTFTQGKTHATGKLLIKNTAYTVLDKILFQGQIPIRFKVNSYSTTPSTPNYSIRIVKAQTKEILTESSFSGTADTDIETIGTYLNNTFDGPIILEIQGKVSVTGSRAFIDGVIIDYN